MKLTVQIQLLPDPEQTTSLRETIERFNAAANWLAGEAFARTIANKIVLQKLHYAELRERFGLPAQMAVRCLAQVCEAYKRDKAIRPQFRSGAAMPFDQRIMSFKGNDHVSLLTLTGRTLVPLVMGEYQREQFANAKGQADLVQRKDGKWFLLVSIDVPAKAPVPPHDFVGVDLGVVNLAADSDRGRHSGAEVEAVRVRQAKRRRALDRAAAARRRRGKRPKSIRRAKARQHKKETRFRKDVNHVISKKLVAKAKSSGRGIGLEDLQGIRDRLTFRRQQRARMSGWAFAQLRQFISYKAALAGVPVVLVDPRNTSRTCAECGHCAKANRPSQAEFRCKSCGHTDDADFNAARNIRARALVNAPMVSEPQPEYPAA